MATCPTCRTHHPDTETVCPADGAQLLPEAVLAAESAELKPGTVVGEYCIEGKLGEGGFGCVYRAVHPVIGKTAAVKVLHYQYSANPQMVSRFVAEARAVNQIRHRGIIDIFSFGRLDDGRQYYVMELLDGMTFDAYLKQRGRLPPGEAIVLLRQVARALDAAHAGGIAHRDLKPENIFLVFDEDGGIQSKLLDFGIAKLLGDSSGGGGHVTRTGVPMGTPLYMSPEQCRGRNVDHRTDVYSFGIMTFETLTGCFPFEAEDMMDLMFKHVSAPPARPSAVCPDLSPELDAPVLEMLEKEADRRPRTLAAAVDGLVQAAQRAGLVVPSSATRSTSVLPRGSGRTQVRSGADAGDVLADARTVAVSGDGATMPAAQAGTTAGSGQGSAKSGKTAALAALAVLLVGVAGGAAVLLRSPPTDSSSSRPATSPDTPAPPAPPPPSVVPAPASSSAAPAELPREVELTIQSKPVGAEIYQGDKRLGVAPGPVLLPRGDADVELTLKAKNHKPFKLVVKPSSSRVVSAELEPAAAVKGPSGASTNKMLEF